MLEATIMSATNETTATSTRPMAIWTVSSIFITTAISLSLFRVEEGYSTCRSVWLLVFLSLVHSKSRVQFKPVYGINSH